MNIAFCSLLLPEDKNITARTKGHLSGVSLHKFSKAIIQGLDANLEEPIKIFNIINTLNFPKFPDLIFKNEIWSHCKNANDVHIGYINIFGLKYITQEINLYLKLKKWMRSIGNQKVIICVHHNYFPMMRAVLKIKKQYGNQVVTCLISGDIPGKFGLKSQYKESFKQKLIEQMEKQILAMVKEFDSFIFQTKYMAEGFDVQDKPVCVLECTYTKPAYSKTSIDEEYKKPGKKIVFYAGSLRKEYDVLHLVRAFSLISGKNYELWLAGGGNAVEDIKEAANKDKRIKYLGFISPNEVASRQEAATVLVSPRTSKHNFVKYSFPSKTMECLASGKPYIAHKLPCEPPEYGNYIQYPLSESDEDFANKIKSVCELPEESRRRLADQARRFIEDEKNPTEMCKRIVLFWNTLLGEDVR